MGPRLSSCQRVSRWVRGTCSGGGCDACRCFLCGVERREAGIKTQFSGAE